MKRFEWCPEVESNHRHKDFQSFALPTELSGHFYVDISRDCVLNPLNRNSSSHYSVVEMKPSA